MKKTKIVATIGPASDSKEVLSKMILKGANVFRLNFSHGTHEYHKANIDKIRQIASKLGKTVGILQDISGPKIRTKDIDGVFTLQANDRLDFYKVDAKSMQLSSNHFQISINHPEILDMLKVGEMIYLCDGSIITKVEEINKDYVQTRLINSGKLSSHKGINFPNTKINIDVLTQKDKKDLLWGVENDVDFIAISFVQSAHDIDNVRKILKENNANAKIFAKIEKFDAVENIDEIIKSSDGIMVARGDLGIEVPYYKVPRIQKIIINKANEANKPVITATQMLYSLATSLVATRAEVSDVANAVLDGTDAVMLSEESAVGIDPANAVDIMSKTIIEAEKNYTFNKLNYFKHLDETDIIAHSSTTLANDLKAKAILALTSSGSSAIRTARYRPNMDIIAIAHSQKTLNHLTIVWGVEPGFVIQPNEHLTMLIASTIKTCNEKELITPKEKYIMVAGIPTGVSGSTNMIRVLNPEQIKYYLSK